jgi:glycosidase
MNSLLEHYRTLIQLRSSHSALQTGSIILLDAGNPAVYAALRVKNDQTLLILANLNDKAVTDYAIDLKDAELAESAYSVETLFGPELAEGLQRSEESFINYRPLDKLKPYAMYVLKLNPK